MQIIGITGTICSGKSTICAFLRDNYRHLVIFDCDSECHKLLQGQDRKKIADEIFGDDQKRNEFEKKIWKKLFFVLDEAILKAEKNGTECFIIDAPLLFQSNLDKKCDKVIFVDASSSEREKRYIGRTRAEKSDFTRRDNIITSFFKTHQDIFKKVDLMIDTQRLGYIDKLKEFLDFSNT